VPEKGQILGLFATKRQAGRAHEALSVLVRLLLNQQLMRLSFLALCSVLVAGCASHGELPVASANIQPAADAQKGVEVRHMYLFAPGKAPVKIVSRDDGSSTPEVTSMPEEVSSEPPHTH
jgi:hypothetical protein